MKAKILFLIVFFFLMSFSLAEVFVGPASDSYFNNVQETPSFSNYYSSQDLADFWPILKDMRDGRCEAATDFAVMIPPGGCTPSVVRSDLLAEQNVPVFCKLVSVQLNPLIRTSAIKSITFKGDYPKEVAGVRFHPNRAGTNVISNTLLNNPIANEVGYVVIILKKTPNESAQTKWISVNLTANLVYDAEGAFGLGKSDFYLESMSDEEWEIKALYNSFWLGKGYVRLLDVDKDKARIAIYLNDKNRPYREMTLKEGQTSEIMYLPGMYCLAGVKLRVNSISGVEDSALLKVNNDFSWVRAGTEILNGRCRVIDMVVDPMENGEIKLRCQGVKDDIRLSLKIALKANITINNTNKIHSVGNIVLEKIDNKNWYLVYTTEKSKIRIANERRAYAVLISERSEQEPSFEKIKILIDGIEKVEYLRDLNSYDDFIRELEKNSRLKNGSDFVVLFPEVEIRIKDTILKLNSVGTEFDKGKDSSLESNKQQIEEYYGKYETAVKNLARDFPNTKEPESNDVFAEKAYIEQIEILTKLVDLGLKTETELNQLKEEFLEKYPRSVYSSKLQIDLLTSKTYDRRNSSVVVNINGINNLISLQKFEVVSPNKKFAEVFVNNKKLGDLNENSIYTLVAKDGRSYGDYIVVDKISKNSIDIIYYENQTSNEKTEIKEIGKFTFGLESKKEIGSQRKYEFYLRRIDLPLSAHVSLIPEEKGARTEANFTFKIGIEKRMFEITPERANKSLERLNKTIKEWEKKLENLGNLVT
ncbi:MAG: hypothetical protein QXX68_02255, partial [Candidatus Pacearchaeota archaeon]